MRFRKKPVEVEALRYTGDNYEEISWYLGYEPEKLNYPVGIRILTLEGSHIASPGDWIIKGVKGEFYPCKPDIFKETYVPAETILHGNVND